MVLPTSAFLKRPDSDYYSKGLFLIAIMGGQQETTAERRSILTNISRKWTSLNKEKYTTGFSERRKGITSKSSITCLQSFINQARFHSFFHHIDHYRSDYFLWVTASGISAAKQSQVRKEDISDEEVDINGQEG